MSHDPAAFTAPASPVLQNIEQVSDGWIKKYILTFMLPDGTSYEYESTSRKALDAYRRELEGNACGKRPTPDAVCVVPQCADGSVILIREFRYPLNSWCISFPAGLIEPGEDLAASIDRELQEEVGYCIDTSYGEETLRSLDQLGYSSTGLTEEGVQVVFAHVKEAGDAHPEPGEFIRPFILKSNEIALFLKKNTLPISTRCQLILYGLANQ